jgi:RES domain-containing protein
VPDETIGWRITQARYTGGPGGGAFSGEGARRYGGRWNSRGTPVAYTAGSRSLALLEILVHLDSSRLLHRYVLLPIRFAAGHVEHLDAGDLPDDWRSHPAPASTQSLGDAWARETRSPVLQVPSVVVPSEPNYIINPLHPDFPELTIGTAEPLDVDPRLLEG